MAGILGDASNARRGARLRTVTEAFPFELDARGTKEASDFLVESRELCNRLRIENKTSDYENLRFLLQIKISKTGSSVLEFEELCEGLISIIYFGLVYHNDKNIHALFRYFFDKWFHNYENDFDKLILDIDNNYQKDIFACALLLYHHYEPIFTCLESVEALTKWSSSALQPPQWLAEVMSCSQDVYGNLAKIICKAFNMGYDASFTRDYLTSLSIFFDACHHYKTSNFEESIKSLSSLGGISCSETLSGWASALMGLNLEKLGKFQAALLKYKDALVICSSTFLAMYYSARIFEEIGAISLQQQSLQLLMQVSVANIADHSFQSTLIRHRLPSCALLPQRALWLLASSNLLQKDWTTARDNFHSLFMQWKPSFGTKKSTNHHLFMASDDLPVLPPKSCFRMGYMATLLALGEFDEVAELDHSIDETDCCDNANDLDKLATLVCQLLAAEAFYQQRRLEEAAGKCGRVMTSVESFRPLTDVWERPHLLLQTYLCTILSFLYLPHTLNMKQNHRHFVRLKEQYSRREQEWQETQDTKDVVVRNVIIVLKDRLASFQ